MLAVSHCLSLHRSLADICKTVHKLSPPSSTLSLAFSLLVETCSQSQTHPTTPIAIQGGFHSMPNKSGPGENTSMQPDLSYPQRYFSRSSPSPSGCHYHFSPTQPLAGHQPSRWYTGFDFQVYATSPGVHGLPLSSLRNPAGGIRASISSLRNPGQAPAPGGTRAPIRRQCRLSHLHGR